MEITIIKSVFITQEIEDPTSPEDLEQKVRDIISENDDITDWNEYDWRGKEVYKIYDTYSGSDLLDLNI